MKKEIPMIWEKRKDCGNMKKHPAKRLVSLLLAALLAFPATAALAAGAGTGATVEVFNSGETSSYGGGQDLTNTEYDPFAPVAFDDPQGTAASAQLVIYAYDVDAPDELDEVFLNGHSLGILTGMDGEWNTTVLEVSGAALASLQDGRENSISMTTNDGWIVYIRSMVLVMGGGADGGEFDRDSAGITAALEGEQITASVSLQAEKDGVYQVEYAVKELDIQGNQVRQVGSRSQADVAFTAGAVYTESQTFLLPGPPEVYTSYRVDYVVKNALQVPVFTMSELIPAAVQAKVVVDGSQNLPGSAVSVSGLEAVAKALADPTKGHTTQLKIWVGENSAPPELEALQASAERDGNTLGLMFDISLAKEVKDAAGQTVDAASGPVDELDGMVQFTIALPESAQGKTDYVVYRSHGGQVDTLTETPNDKGEKMALHSDGTAIDLTVCRFSTYVVGYRDTGAAPAPTPPADRLDDEPNTGASGRGAGWAAGLGILAAGALLFWKLRRGEGTAR